jgi:hypothetical protein
MKWPLEMTKGETMQYWWVNQNQTYQFEVPGGYLWSPKRNRDGAFNQFYENMKDVSPGDVVFSFKDTLIKAVGVAAGGEIGRQQRIAIVASYRPSI